MAKNNNRILRGHKSPEPNIPDRLDISAAQTDFENTSAGGINRKAKTKQELAQIRKQMMKKKFNPAAAQAAVEQSYRNEMSIGPPNTNGARNDLGHVTGQNNVRLDMASNINDFDN